MRKVILFVNTTLDGFMGGPNGELDWMVLDDEMDKEFTTDLRRTVDTILSGRATYQGFEQYWPARAEDPASPEDLADFAKWMVDTPKVVFSRSLEKVEMKNSRLAEADIAGEVADLKRQPGGDMVLFGGASTVQAFVKLGLIDEYRIKIHPVAIGRGLAVFSDLEAPAKLEVVKSKTYSSGILGVHFQPVS